MFETLAACDALISDYSATIFDASLMRVPVFLYVYDLEEYVAERGKLMWDIHSLPFPIAKDDEELCNNIRVFDVESYYQRLKQLFDEVELFECGNASCRVADIIEKRMGDFV